MDAAGAHADGFGDGPVGVALFPQVDDHLVAHERRQLDVGGPIPHGCSVSAVIRWDFGSSAGISYFSPEFRRSLLNFAASLEAEAAAQLDMSERTIQRMIAAGSMTGYVDWDEIASKLIPIRPRRQ